MINKERGNEEDNKKKMKTLEQKLVMMRQKTSQRSRMLSELD